MKKRARKRTQRKVRGGGPSETAEIIVSIDQEAHIVTIEFPSGRIIKAGQPGEIMQ